VLAPKHPTLVCALTLLLIAATGWVMVTFRVVVHPLASVIVQVHVPAVRFVALALVCTGAVFQLNPYGAVPPDTDTVALPVFAPKHPTFVWALTLPLRAAVGCVIVTFWVVEHPLASVIVQVRKPSGRLFAVAPVCTGEEFQE